MQELVGRRRRQEVREAIDMRHELKSTFALTSAALAVGAGLAICVYLLAAFGLLMWGGPVRLLPAAVIFILLCIVCSRAHRISGLREEYREHCRRYNITEEDMRALEHEEL